MLNEEKPDERFFALEYELFKLTAKYDHIFIGLIFDASREKVNPNHLTENQVTQG